jgi:hypothetical protein
MFAFANGQLRNYWNFGLNAFQFFTVQRDNLTRGGPSAENPRSHSEGFWFETDNRKRVTANVEVFHERSRDGASFLGNWLNVKLKPSSGLSLQFGPSFRKPLATAQWVGGFDDATALETYGRRYVFANLRQTEVVMTTRVNWILSPRLSLQVYAQPLISSGDYTVFKEFLTPRRFEFARYGVDRGTIAYDADAREYRVDPDGSGPAPAFTFGSPDFNFKSLRLNAVFRWEWRLGSTLYVVWTQNRTSDVNPGTFEFRRDVSDLFGANPDDVFLVKFSYRLGR